MDENAIRSLTETFEYKYYFLSSTSRAHYEETNRILQNECDLSLRRNKKRTKYLKYEEPKQNNFTTSLRFCLQKSCEDEAVIDSIKYSYNPGEQ